MVGNRFIDNWGAVIGWENADRFAGSPEQHQHGHHDPGEPEVATVANCGDPDLIASDPYFDDCRWKTQHLRV